MMIDTHCHIQFQAYTDDRDAVISRCTEKKMILNLVGTQKDTSRLAVELAEQHENMYASIGTHPIHLFPTHVDEEETHFVSREESFDWEYYRALAQSSKVIGVGETGLDLFHVPKDKTVDEILEKQKIVFLDHVAFARQHDLPLVIHCREAHDEMIETLQSEIIPASRQGGNHKSEIRGTVHCFTSHWGHAQQYLELGFYLGFTGVITFPPKKTDPRAQEQLLEVIDKIPLDRIVVETDAPYLAPQAYRGKRSEPWMVEENIGFIADRRGICFAEMQAQIEQNTRVLFSKIPSTEQ